MKLIGDHLAVAGVYVDLVKVEIHAVSKNCQVSIILKVACLTTYSTNEDICIADQGRKKNVVADGKIKKVEAGSDCAWANSVTLRSTCELDIFGKVS